MKRKTQRAEVIRRSALLTIQSLKKIGRDRRRSVGYLPAGLSTGQAVQELMKGYQTLDAS